MYAYADRCCHEAIVATIEGTATAAAISAFVRYTVPYGGSSNTLSKQDAFDVAVLVLSHVRPNFDKSRTIAFPAQRSDTF